MTSNDNNDDLRKWSEESLDYIDDNVSHDQDTKESSTQEKAFKLSDEQQKIVDLDIGQHLVLAPPGTGKTEMLVHRLSNAINSGIPQDKMACLTFTNRAASNMVERIHQEIGNHGVFIGNIHSYCNNFIRDNNIIPQIISLIDEEDSHSIVSDIFKDIFKELDDEIKQLENLAGEINLFAENPYTDKHKRVDSKKNIRKKYQDLKNFGGIKRFITHLTYLKRKKLGFNEGINLGCIDFSVGRSESGQQHLLALSEIILEKYEAVKNNSDYIDFDDLLTITYGRLLSDENISDKTPLLQWLQIDEVQDLNPLQWAIINKVSNKKYSHRVFFGDPEQAIFSFMGASQENLKSISRECKIHGLRTNYRSPQYLLDLYIKFANEVLDVNWISNPKSSKDTLKHADDLQIEEYIGVDIRNKRGRTVLSRCDQLHEARHIVVTKFPVQENLSTAILVRKNITADYFESQFKKNHPNIKIFKVSGTDLFSRKIVKDVLAIFNTFVNKRDKLSWARVFHICTKTTLKKSRLIVDEIFSSGVNPLDFILDNKSVKSYLDDFLHLFNNDRIIVFDTETTGLDTNQDDVIQIAAIEVIKGIPGKIYEVYIDTDRDFSEAEKIHNISKEHLINHAIDKVKALSDFIKFVNNDALIAHNLDYDYKILNANLKSAGLPSIASNISLYDSIDLAQRVYPKLPRYKLEYLLKTLKIQGNNSHNAIDDVKATVNLISHCIKEIKSSKSSGLDYNDKEVIRLLGKFSKRFSPLYKMLATNSMAVNLGKVTTEIVSYIDNNLNSESNKYPDEAYDELKKLTIHMSHICQDMGANESVKKYIPDYAKYKEVDLKLDSDNIVIATIHKAKGLEFDYVIIPQCAENNYPSYFSLNPYNEEAVMEDARLLYVAMTRAKRKLLITCSSDIYIDTPNYQGHFSQNISQFLSDIKPMFKSTKLRINTEAH
jgi:DNA helicase-2/ATP-dependent DNA helicase PcrA